jgi:very-short-patch-repair endonuclease
MQEITEKLHKMMMEDFRPVAEKMASEGHDADEIVATFQNHLKIKTEEFYKIDKSPKKVSEILAGAFGLLEKQSADSKAESIFYQMLHEHGLRFDFQYSIGPYRADYLFSGFLVVELDGPQHEKDYDEKRDAYMRRMGYKIIRVPINILIWSPYAVIEEIQEAIFSEDKKRKKHAKIKTSS